MNLNVNSYNQQYLAAGKIVLDSDLAGNDPFAKFGVRLVEADVVPGETYWKVIGIHHLLPVENRGDGHVYLEALDEAGVRIQNPMVWANNQDNTIQEPVKLEKPAAEPAGNIPMFKAKHVVRIRGLSINANDKSDSVENLHTDHDNEPEPADGLGGNTRFHHSFYVVYQRTRKAEGGPGPQPVSFMQFAQEHGLGNAVTPKFAFQQHQVQAFERGVVFARNDQPNSIQHQLW
jgi:hypothetical protein